MAAFVLFLLMTLLWISRFTKLYRHILTIWGVEVFDFPFVDTETVLSGARCLRAGVDVYVSNPCDTLGRVYDYSPLWMLLARLPVTIAWGVPGGLLVAALYIGAVALLPEGRTAGHRGTLILGATCSVAAFAVERGNNDVVLFALAAFAATLACRSPAVRLIGYGCALLAGLLKYFPLALMALAARERPARLLAIAVATLVLIGLFVTLAWHDLTRALGLIPTGKYSEGMFGSIQVAGGIQTYFHLSPGVIPIIRWTMSLIALAVGAFLASRSATAAALEGLTSRERALLLAGGLLTLACFFTAQNIGYRAIHLLLTLPGLLALSLGGARAFRPAPWLALALLWTDFWRRALVYAGKPFGAEARHVMKMIGWGIRELCWWWLIPLLAACVFTLLWRSALVQSLLKRRPILWL